MTEKSRQIVCLICGHPSRTMNLGVDSCKACTNFFKRSLALDKKYVCRKNSGKCAFKRGDPSTCRRCRFDKCTAVGMKVLPKFEDTEDEEDEIKYNDAFVHNCELVSKMAAEYNKEIENTIEKEKSLRAKVPFNHSTVLSPSGNTFFICSCDYIYNPLTSMNVNIDRLSAAVFSEYVNLNSEDKATVIRSCATAFYIAQGNFLTEKHFPGLNRFVVINPWVVMDVEHPEMHIAEGDTAANDMARAIKFYREKTIGLTRPILREAALTEIEFYAALCLSVWNFDFAPWVPEHIWDVGDGVRKRIFDELNWYYKMELKCPDIAVRMGRLMLFVNSVQEASVLHQEQLETYKLLGSIIDEDVLYTVATGGWYTC